MTPNTDDLPERDDQFDTRMRATLVGAMPAGDVPPGLLRPEPRWTPRFIALTCAGLLIGVLTATIMLLRPPALVEAALVHERNERTLRGDFMPSRAPIASYFGLSPSALPPGLLQMAKPCRIANRIAYHMTTWLDGVDGGGMVTAITFAQPVDLPERSGWWPDTYWRVIRTARGVSVMLFAQNRKAIDAAVERFR